MCEYAEMALTRSSRTVYAHCADTGSEAQLNPLTLYGIDYDRERNTNAHAKTTDNHCDRRAFDD